MARGTGSTYLKDKVVREFYGSADNGSGAIAKRLGVKQQDVVRFIEQHLKAKHENPPIVGKERVCDCYRGLKKCFCDVRKI